VTGQGDTTIAYFPSGLVHVVTRPDGTTTTTEYDNAARIQSIVHANAGGEVAHEHYDYDLNGNRWHQYESNGALTQDAQHQPYDEQTTYTYDASDRLTDTAIADIPATGAAVPVRATHYAIDGVGNRINETIRNAAGAVISNSTLSYNEREQLYSRDDATTHLHVDITYDADGNTATESDSTGTLKFGWDGHDRLLALGQSLTSPNLTFEYQSDDLRIAKHQSGAQTRYQYDGQSLLAETNSIGNPLVRYHYSATELLSRSETSGTAAERQYLNDALNTPIATTKQGAVDSRTKYDAWGEITSQQGIGGAVTTPSTDGTFAELPSTDNQDIGFTGYVKDGETGFYYAKARYYDPRIARFASEDPEEGKAMQPPSLHRYLYAYANPTRFSDRTGRNSEEIQGGIGVLQLVQDYLDEKTKQLPEDRVGNTISGGIGLGQLFLGLTKNALQVVDAADDLAKVGIASTGVQVDQAQLAGSKKGLERSGNFAVSAANYLLNGGPIKTAIEIDDTFRQAEQGNNLAISRTTSLFGGLLTGSGEVDAIATAGAAERGFARLEGPGTHPLLPNESSATQTAADAREASATTPSQLHQEPDTLGPTLGASDAGRPLETRLQDTAAVPVVQNATNESNYVLLNKTHANSMPKPKGFGPNNGRLQSHHGLQQQWAKENLQDYGYDPDLAPTVTMETGKELPHTKISLEQNARRNARVADGVGKWSSSLQQELGYIVNDFRAAGFVDPTIQSVLEQQYKMLERLNVPFKKLEF